MSICPTCKKTLGVISYEGKDLLQCRHCRGFWFTDGQFREVKQIGFSGLCTGEAPAQAAGDDAGDMPELACPDCARQALLTYNYAYSSDIQLHRCAACKGIWAEQHALSEIDALLTNYQESLEEAKAKAMPLMMEVKKKITEQEEARKAERQDRKKPGLLGKFFRKKPQKTHKPVDIFADMRTDGGIGSDANIHDDNDEEYE